MRTALAMALVFLIACVGCGLEPGVKASREPGDERDQAAHHRWLVRKQLTDIRQESLVDEKKALDSLNALKNTIREKKLLIDQALIAEIDAEIEFMAGHIAREPRPPLTATQQAKLARAHYSRGKDLFDDIIRTDPGKRHYGKAIAEFDQAILLQPGYAEAYLARGYACYYAGRNARAIEDYSQAIRLGLETTPHGPSPYLLRGFAWVYEGKYEKAIDDYNRAIDLEPENSVAWYNRGVAYKRLGKETRGEADMARARELGFQD